jgi:hypothetical protein
MKTNAFVSAILATGVIFAASACACSCGEKNHIDYHFPDADSLYHKDTVPTPVNPGDTTVHKDSLVNRTFEISGYPEGVRMYGFQDWVDSTSKCVGWYAIADTKANPKLRFNAMYLADPVTPSTAFKQFKTLGKGTPLVTVNGGYWYNGESLSLLVSDSTVKSIAAQMTWVTVNGATVTVFPVRAALGRMSDGTFEATWVYCPSDGLQKPYSYPSPLDNNEKTHKFMTVAPKHNNNGAKLWTPMEAIGGGPMIVFGGEDVAERNYWKEVLDEGGTAGLSRQPRTCIAATGDGKVIFFVCDGRGENGSVGFTLSEMAQKLIKLGATMAVNLDGGGSSVFVGKEGLVVNRPSDSKENVEITERKVTTAVTLSVME